MVLNSSAVYPPFLTVTQTRVLVLAPGGPDDLIRCFHLVIDLDADWKLPNSASTSQPAIKSHAFSHIEVEDTDGAMITSFTLPPLQLRKIDDGGGLHPFQSYTALSYVWGDQSNLRKILLNNQPFFVGGNLHMALRRLRNKMGLIMVGSDSEDMIGKEMFGNIYSSSGGPLLWIDALCINQSDTLEREAQVKLMARIYRQADHVYVDLGYSQDVNGMELIRLFQTIMDAGSACDAHRQSSQLRHSQKRPDYSSIESKIISGVGKNWQTIGSKWKRFLPPPSLPTASDQTLEHYGLPPADDEIWIRWRQLINSAYFTRLWVIQEFALARSLSIWFGNVGFEPTMISDCMLYMGKYSTNRTYYLAADFSQSARDALPAAGFSALINLFSHRTLVHNSALPSTQDSCLLDKLNNSRGTKATDQRDKIYGMLGLASDATAFLPLVSYSKSVGEIFMGFAKRFIEVGQGMKLLYQIDSCSSSTLGVPNWIPDWSRNSCESSIYHRQPDQKLYAASQMVPPSIRIREADFKLEVNGALFDTITRLSKPLAHDSSKVDQFDFHKFIWEGGHFTLDFKANPDGYPTGEDSSDVMMWTLVCDRRESKSPEEISRLRQSLWAILGQMTSLAGRGLFSDSAWLPHLRDIMQSGLPNSLGRSWCLTENGYMGLVPGRAKIGDRISLFYGGALPFIIRPHSGSQDTEFRLVGHGYFHGLMHGEAFDVKSFNPQRIVLT